MSDTKALFISTTRFYSQLYAHTYVYRARNIKPNHMHTPQSQNRWASQGRNTFSKLVNKNKRINKDYLQILTLEGGDMRPPVVALEGGVAKALVAIQGL